MRVIACLMLLQSLHLHTVQLRCVALHCMMMMMMLIVSVDVEHKKLIMNNRHYIVRYALYPISWFVSVHLTNISAKLRCPLVVVIVGRQCAGYTCFVCDEGSFGTHTQEPKSLMFVCGTMICIFTFA